MLMSLNGCSMGGSGACGSGKDCGLGDLLLRRSGECREFETFCGSEADHCPGTCCAVQGRFEKFCISEAAGSLARLCCGLCTDRPDATALLRQGLEPLSEPATASWRSADRGFWLCNTAGSRPSPRAAQSWRSRHSPRAAQSSTERSPCRACCNECKAPETAPLLELP